MSDQNMMELENIQRSATRIIYPDFPYEDCLSAIYSIKLSDLIFSIGYRVTFLSSCDHSIVYIPHLHSRFTDIRKAK